MTTVAPSLRSFAALRWSEVEPDFHVGARDGEFVGYVDTNADGTFVAFDGHSTAVGRFRTLADAKASLLTTDHPANVRRDRLARRVMLGVATGAGSIAAGLALTAGVLAPIL